MRIEKKERAKCIKREKCWIGFFSMRAEASPGLDLLVTFLSREK
jgi:hypothetical protein